jgi:hypothetical protein
MLNDAEEPESRRADVQLVDDVLASTKRRRSVWTIASSWWDDSERVLLANLGNKAVALDGLPRPARAQVLLTRWRRARRASVQLERRPARRAADTLKREWLSMARQAGYQRMLLQLMAAGVGRRQRAAAPSA